LSFRFVRYLFSIILCAVFLTGGALSFLDAGPFSLSSELDFLFFEATGTGSGEDVVEDALVGPLFWELGLWWRLGVDAGGACAEEA
jgi:hypothetical protein